MMEFNLPNSSYIVLGLLSFGEARSGYEVRKLAQNLQYFYWSPAQSQIYKELRRLEEHGLARSEYVEQDGKPNKQMFEITAEGTAVFKTWLATADLPPTVIKHPLLLKLFFGHMTDSQTKIQLITQFIDNTKQMLAQLAIVQEHMEIDPDLTNSALVVEWSLHHYESELQMAEKLLGRMGS